MTIRQRFIHCTALLAGCCWLTTGCSRDVRLTGRTIPSVTVRAVTHYGVTLDEPASPEQVAYVLLRAIRDDFLAGDEAAREAALAIQFDVCAARELAARNPTSAHRDEFIYSIVHHWTPTVSHYVHDFEPDWAKSQGRFVRRDLPSAGLR